MKILMHSIAGDGVGLAAQCASEGHDVMLHLCGGKSKLYDGLLWKSSDWEHDAKQSDIVIFDGNGMGKRAEGLRAAGVKVWNGSALADALEKQRGFGMKVFEKAGIPLPETFYFKNGKEAHEIVKANFKPSDRMVIKLDDFGACATSYVAKNQKDMFAQIETWIADPSLGAIDKGGIIQRFVEGVEISIEGWFNGTDFMYPFNVTMEDKPLLNEGLGQNTGCAQNVVWQLRKENAGLMKMIQPLVPMLRKGGFVGQIDVNTIIGDDGPVALEFTPRPGFDATSTLVLGLEGYGAACAAALAGEKALPLSEHPWRFLTACRAWIPPYPFESTSPKFNAEIYESVEGVPIEGWEPENRRVILYDAMHKEEKLVIAGTSGIPFITLGMGKTIDQAVEDCYAQFKGLHVPNIGYRTDLGDRVKENWEAIRDYI